MYRMHIVTWYRDEYVTLRCDEKEAHKRFFRTVKHLSGMGTKITLYPYGQMNHIARYREGN